MRIGVLSRTSGVSVPTIKFYVREGLLPPGTPTAAPNQVDYDESHLHRLILLRALIEVGGLSLATTRNAVRRLAFPTTTQRDMLVALLSTPSPAPEAADKAGVDERTSAQKAVGRLLRDREWQDAAASAPVGALVRAVAALKRLGHDASDARLALYADAAEKLTKRERGQEAARTDVSAAEAALVEAVVLGAVLTSMRELAHLRASDEPTERPGKPEDRPAKKRPKRK